MKKKTLLMSVSALALLCGVASCGHEHEFGSSWSKDATHHWHAAVCEHTEEVADKAAHSWDQGTVTKQATEEAKGETTYKCTVCNATKVEEIAQLEHTHKFGSDWANDATYHWHASTCGHANEVADKAEHTWNEGKVTKAPTYSAAGEKAYECTACGYDKVEEIAKLETKLVLNASDFEVGTFEAGSVVEKNGFTLITDNPGQAAEKIDKVLVVDEVDVTIGEEQFAQRIKTGGGSNTTADAEERVISFETTGKGTIKVYAKHGSTDETKPAAKVFVMSVEDGVQHDAKEITVAEGAVMVELEMHYAGQFYLASTANISIYKVEVVWEDGVNDTTWEPTVELSDANVLNVSEISARTIEKDLEVGNFVINAGIKGNEELGEEDQSVSIDNNNKTYDGVSYTARLKLGGLGTEDYRSVTINVDGPSTITVVVCSSNSSTRTVNLFDAAGNGISATDDSVSGSVTGLLYEVPAAGAYNFRVTGGGGGANIYAIIVEAGVSEPEPDPTPDPDPTPNPDPGTPFDGFTLDYAALLTELGGTVVDKAAIDENSAQLSTLGLLDLTGTNTIRYSDSKGLYAIEIAKNGTGSVTFTAPTDVVLTLGIASTGSSNTSAYAVMVNGTSIASNENPDVTVGEVTGTSAVIVTYNIAAGSVVEIVSPQSDYNRGFRLMSLSIALQS